MSFLLAKVIGCEQKREKQFNSFTKRFRIFYTLVAVYSPLEVMAAVMAVWNYGTIDKNDICVNVDDKNDTLDSDDIISANYAFDGFA